MKQRLFLFAILSGLLLSSCNLEKCACSTFGMKEDIKPVQVKEIMVSTEKQSNKHQ